jgi:hypothetical protein
VGNYSLTVIYVKRDSMLQCGRIVARHMELDRIERARLLRRSAAIRGFQQEL